MIDSFIWPQIKLLLKRKILTSNRETRHYRGAMRRAEIPWYIDLFQGRAVTCSRYITADRAFVF